MSTYIVAAPRSALHAFSRVAASETVADGVTFASLRMPPERRPGDVSLPLGACAEPVPECVRSLPRKRVPRTPPPAGVTRPVLRAVR